MGVLCTPVKPHLQAGQERQGHWEGGGWELAGLTDGAGQGPPYPGCRPRSFPTRPLHRRPADRLIVSTISLSYVLLMAFLLLLFRGKLQDGSRRYERGY